MGIDDFDAGDMLTLPTQKGAWRLYQITMKTVQGDVTLKRLDRSVEYASQTAAEKILMEKREVGYMRRQGTGNTDDRND